MDSDSYQFAMEIKRAAKKKSEREGAMNILVNNSDEYTSFLLNMYLEFLCHK